MFVLCNPNVKGYSKWNTLKIWWLKKWLSAYKCSNISETRQDRTKVTIEVE